MTLVAYPFTGEFGWELMSWQGYLRKLSKNYDRTVVLGQRGHGPLYSDFAEFVDVDLMPGGDCWNSNTTRGFNLPRINLALRPYETSKGFTVLRPTRRYTLEEQEFIQFGKKAGFSPRPLVLLHGRNRGDRKPEVNWPAGNLMDLAHRLRNWNMDVATIGDHRSHQIAGVKAYNSIGLAALCDIMRQATLVVGPSSGPMHLASLCGAPHLVWTDDKRYVKIKGTNKERYETIWNPLKTKAHVLECGWQPRAEDIANEIKGIVHGR